jgi:hypothetical protein
LDVVNVNTSIQIIELPRCHKEHVTFRKSDIPYLKTNRLQPRLLAIQKTRPIAYRAKVLGRAVLSARTDANTFWMLLSGNAEVALPSSTTAIAVAANLPTPATSTSTANVADVAASEMSDFTTNATGSLPTADASASSTAASAVTPSVASASDAFVSNVAAAAAANVATPSAGQKRKAHS